MSEGPDQAKLVLELQEENRELRVKLVEQEEKLLTLEAETLAAAANNNISPTPPSISSLMTPPSALTAQQKKKPRHSLLSGTCFTPESSKRRKAEDAVKELQLTVKALKMEMERMKREHVVQMKKQKEELMKELCSKKSEKTPERGKETTTRRIVTRGSLRPKEREKELIKSPSHRFASPAAPAKKRSFWDITVANSPSLDRRKTRSHVLPVNQEAPSMLLQPGFARPRTTTTTTQKKH